MCFLLHRGAETLRCEKNTRPNLEPPVGDIGKRKVVFLAPLPEQWSSFDRNAMKTNSFHMF